MDTVFPMLVVLGVLTGIVAFTWLVVLAWKQSPLWGLFVLLFSLVGIAWFLFKHPRETAKPCLLGLAGMLAMIAGMMAIWA